MNKETLTKRIKEDNEMIDRIVHQVALRGNHQKTTGIEKSLKNGLSK